MARLTQAEAREQTRRNLLAAARRAFGERGFGGASLDEIAESAGYTRGALYYNFPGGKEELFIALLEERIDNRVDVTRTAFADAGADPADTIAKARAAAAEAGAAVRENREWQLLFFEFALHGARDARFARRLAKSEARLRDALADIIEERATVLGGEPPIPPDHLARTLNALANGIMLDRLIEPEAVPDDLLDQSVELLVAGAIAQGAAGA